MMTRVTIIESVVSPAMLLQHVDDAQQGLVNRCGDAVTRAQLHHFSRKNLDLGFTTGLNIL